jgi:hypothetical protein
MSWFFDTENWASGIWNSWAEARTDTWRAAMIRAVPPGGGSAPFAVTAPGTDTGDFSFVVIGDTGEGDASQHALRDQLLTVTAEPGVRFVVISSDVVYPNGSMIDYEANFWLPFKGVTKPVFAIPGNHDWYDALEAFLATFLQPDAAASTASSPRPTGSGASTACRPASSAAPSSSSTPPGSRWWPSTPASSSASIPRNGRGSSRHCSARKAS